MQAKNYSKDLQKTLQVRNSVKKCQRTLQNLIQALKEAAEDDCAKILCAASDSAESLHEIPESESHALQSAVSILTGEILPEVQNIVGSSKETLTTQRLKLLADISEEVIPLYEVFHQQVCIPTDILMEVFKEESKKITKLLRTAGDLMLDTDERDILIRHIKEHADIMRTSAEMYASSNIYGKLACDWCGKAVEIAGEIHSIRTAQDWYKLKKKMASCLRNIRLNIHRMRAEKDIPAKSRFTDYDNR